MTPDRERVAFLRRALKAWGRKHVRRFPWRKTRDPYRVLIAELMLRRTRPAQVLPVYRTFIVRYRSPRELATATDEDLSRLLTPLGLHWRARNVMAIARQVAHLAPAAYRNGALLKRLPGVGDYVSSAVQIMVFNRPACVIDTNVIRVLGRYWGLPVHPEARRQRAFKEVARRCVPRRDAKLYTLALLDLGATICTPRGPRCRECPLQVHCRFAQDISSPIPPHAGQPRRVRVA